MQQNQQLQNAWTVQQNAAVFPSSQLILRQNSAESQDFSTEEREIVRATPQVRRQTLTQYWLQSLQNLYVHRSNLQNVQKLQEQRSYSANAQNLYVHRSNLQNEQKLQELRNGSHNVQAVQNRNFHAQILQELQSLQEVQHPHWYKIHAMQTLHSDVTHSRFAPQYGDTHQNQYAQNAWTAQQNASVFPSSQLILRQNSTEQQEFSAEARETVRETPQVGRQTLTQHWLQTLQNLYVHRSNLQNVQKLQALHGRSTHAQAMQIRNFHAQILQELQSLQEVQYQQRYESSAMQTLHSNVAHSIFAPHDGDVHQNQQSQNAWTVQKNADVFPSSQLILRQNSTESQDFSTEEWEIVRATPQVRSQTLTQHWLQTLQNLYVHRSNLQNVQKLQELRSYSANAQNLYVHRSNLQNEQKLQELRNGSPNVQAVQNRNFHAQILQELQSLQEVQYQQRYESSAMQTLHSNVAHSIFAPQYGDTHQNQYAQNAWTAQQNTSVFPSSQLILRQNSAEKQEFSAEAPETVRETPQVGRQTLTQHWLQTLQNLYVHRSNLQNVQKLQALHGRSTHAQAMQIRKFHAQILQELQSLQEVQYQQRYESSAMQTLHSNVAHSIFAPHDGDVQQNQQLQNAWTVQQNAAVFPSSQLILRQNSAESQDFSTEEREIVRATPQVRRQTLTQYWLQSLQNLYVHRSNLQNVQKLQEQRSYSANAQNLYVHRSNLQNEQKLQELRNGSHNVQAVQNRNFHAQILQELQSLQEVQHPHWYKIHAMQTLHSDVTHSRFAPQYGDTHQNQYAQNAWTAQQNASVFPSSQLILRQNSTEQQEFSAEARETVRETPQVGRQTLTQHWLQTLQNLYVHRSNLQNVQKLQALHGRSTHAQAMQIRNFHAQILQELQSLQEVQYQQRYESSAMQTLHSNVAHSIFAPHDGDVHQNQQSQNAWTVQKNADVFPSSQLILRQNSTESQDFSTEEWEIVRATPQVRSQTLTQHWLQTLQNLYVHRSNLQNVQKLQELRSYSANAQNLYVHRSNLQNEQKLQELRNGSPNVQAVQNRNFHAQILQELQSLQEVQYQQRYESSAMQTLHSNVAHSIFAPQYGDTHQNQYAQNAWTAQQNTSVFPSSQLILRQNSAEKQEFSAEAPETVRETPQVGRQTLTQHWLQTLQNLYVHRSNLQNVQKLQALHGRSTHAQAMQIRKLHTQILQKTMQANMRFVQIENHNNEVQTTVQQLQNPLGLNQMALTFSNHKALQGQMTTTARVTPKQPANNIPTEMIYRTENAHIADFSSANPEMPELSYSIPNVSRAQRDAEEHADGEQELLRQVQATTMQKGLSSFAAQQQAETIPSESTAAVTKAQVQQMMEDYQSVQNQRLVRQVMEKMEQTLRMERRRFGKLR